MIPEQYCYLEKPHGNASAWATGKTIEEARKELISIIEGWIALRLRMGRSIPPIGGHVITASIEISRNPYSLKGK